MQFDSLKERINIISKYKELLKHISSQDDRFTILSFMFELTWTWFEEYVAEYLKNIRGYDFVDVTWWINDKGIDIKAEKQWHYSYIQCKKFWVSHTTEKEILYFIKNTRIYKEKLWDTLSLYFVTTNWVNKYAWRRAKEAWINILSYNEILKMNQWYSIDDFIKKHKWNSKILSGIDVFDVLKTYLFRTLCEPMPYWFADFFYLIANNIIFKYMNFDPNYDELDKLLLTDRNPEWWKVFLKKSPIDAKDTFVWKITPIFD